MWGGSSTPSAFSSKESKRYRWPSMPPSTARHEHELARARGGMTRHSTTSASCRATSAHVPEPPPRHSHGHPCRAGRHDEPRASVPARRPAAAVEEGTRELLRRLGKEKGRRELHHRLGKEGEEEGAVTPVCSGRGGMRTGQEGLRRCRPWRRQSAVVGEEEGEHAA